MAISVTVDASTVMRELQEFGSRKAVTLADRTMSLMAGKIRFKLQDEMQSVFDRPTPCHPPSERTWVLEPFQPCQLPS